MNKSRTSFLYLFAFLLLFVFSGLTASAQLQTNNQALQKTSQQLAAQYQSFRKILLQTAREKGWPLTLRNKKGRMAYLRGVNSQGLPYYVTTTDNIISAATIRTNALWPGGSTGLNLNGSSANLKGRIAVWDEGLVRPTHVELAGRVVQEDKAQGDTVVSDHSTHVSGTMIATGVNPAAKGMSFGTQLLQAYDFTNDESEMAGAAGGSNGIIVSNHSYADIAGWYLDASENDRWEFWGNPGDTVDIKFGLYDNDTKIWDSIAYIAPYYLICKAGGNNPGETGPSVGQPYWRMNSQGTFVNSGNRPAGISNNAGFKTIATYGCAKNILTLGAVNPIPGGYSGPSDVVQASFSSLGPTGDGRIKPDVVADGVNVLSTIGTADNAYDIYSGTSMATPATSGSAFLLQEYYSRLHNDSLMYSATLKGLLIHTADEAGANPGPDYTYGWGLVDMQKAAAVITADHTDQSQQIKQSSLTNGTKDLETFTVTASGKMPLSATICWTDPPGTVASIPVNSHNFPDTVRKLVNDLDLRIKDNTTGTVYMPWILNPSNPGAAATKGDNIRDNVEKVELGDSLVPGRTYTITVSHKGTLQHGNTQAYSLMISGVGTSYCPSASTATTGTAFSKVTINNTIYNAGTLSTNAEYIDSSGGNAIQLAVGQTYPMSLIYQNFSGGTLTANIAVYIDANSNDTFENSELVYSANNLTSLTTSSTQTGNFIVPVSARAGTYARMRVIVEDGAAPAACGTYTSGETMDFRVAFISPANDVGVTAFEYPSSSICASDSQLVSIHIHNFGTVSQTGGIPVSTVISSNGTPVKTMTGICLDSIPPGGDVIFTYNTTFVSVAGQSYTFFSKTALASDPNTANDTLTAGVSVNAAEPPGTGAATICGQAATSVVLHANTAGDDLALWYDSPTATTPIAAGNNTTTGEITSNKTYYLGLNDLKIKAGPSNKNAGMLASSSTSLGGAYFRFGGNFVRFSTYIPLTIESAKMYIGHTGKISFTLAQFLGADESTGSYRYSYIPILTNTIDVYPTMPNYNSKDTAYQINVPAGSTADTGAYFLLNIPIPNPGDYILIINTQNYAQAYLSANIKTDPYPLTLPGVMAITGNDMIDVGKADSISYSHSFYYPLFDIGIRLEGCPSTGRTAVTATTEASPVITQQGTALSSSVASGNQWYLNDTLQVDSTAQQITPSKPGVYYTMINDATTGCILKSNSIVYVPNSGDANSRIGLRVWPSPGPGYFNVTFFMDTQDNLSIAFFDIFGQKVYQKDYGSFTGAFSDQLSTTLAAGIYTMKIYHGSDTYIYKVIVRH